MTTLMVVDGKRDETRTQAVARRLRGELAELQVSVSEVARRIGWTQAALSRRMVGQVAFDVELLGLICDTVGIDYNYITTGIRALPDASAAPPSQPTDEPVHDPLAA